MMRTRRKIWNGLAAIVATVGLCLSISRSFAADESPASAPVKAPAAKPVSANVLTNAALQKIEYPQSEFVFRPGHGRDPFFPRSTRRTTPIASSEPAKTIEPEPEPTPTIMPTTPKAASSGPMREVDPQEGTEFFTLKGILATRSRRLATLNTTVKSYIFQTGDEMMLRVPDGKMRVRCLEIRSRSAVFQLEGKREPVVLRLRDQL